MTLDLGTLNAYISIDDREFGKGLDRGERRFGVFSKQILKAASVASVAAGAALVIGATRQFAALQTGMNEVFTLLPGISESAMGKMTDQVKGFSKEFGVLPDQVVPALYQALSAGVPTGNVFDFMESAQKAAKGGATDLETAVSAITGVTNAYGSDVVSAAKASDLMFTTVRLGVTDFGKLSASLGDVTPIASALGVSFEDVSAAMAASTAITGNTAKSATGLKTLLAELGKEGQVAAKNFEKIAGKSFPDFIAAGGSLEDALKMMAESAKDSGGSMIDMFGSIEAGSFAASVTTGDGAKKFSVAMGEMQDSTGDTDKAFDRMNQGLGVSWEKIKTAAAIALVDMGQKLEPLAQGVADFALVALPMVVDAAGDLVDGLEDLGVAIDEVVGFIEDHDTAAKIIVGTITVLLLPALVAWGVQALISAGKATAAWLMSKISAIGSATVQILVLTLMTAGWIAAATQATLSAARIAGAWLVSKVAAAGTIVPYAITFAFMAAGWIAAAIQATASALLIAAAWLIALGPIGLVILAIAALVFFIVKNWDTIKEKTKEAWDWVVDKVEKVWNKIKEKVSDGADSVVSFMRGLPRRIKSAVGGLFDGIKDAFKSALNWIIGKWNNFSLKIGGGSFMGKTLPSVTLNTPDIPMLANGGLVKASRGGTLAVLAEAGEDEWAVPESKADAFARSRLAGSGYEGLGYPTSDRGPLIGAVYQTPGQSADDLAEMLWRKSRARA